VNDTTSTPDEPDDGRGRVATGEQATIPQQQAGGPKVAQPADPGSAAGANGSTPAQVDAAATAEPATEPGAESATETPADPAAETPAETPADPAVDPAGMDAPTAQLRLPPTPGAAAEVPVATAPAPPKPAPRPPEPEPAPGPIPGPGPEAAEPPPWQRMPGPGRDDPEQKAQAAADPHAGDLLDEGPTAFLEPPPLQADAERSEGARVPDAGSWSSVRAVRNRPPRQAALQLKRLDPWSALKLGLVLAVVLFFIWMVAIGVLYGALDGMGVWDRLNGTYADLVSGDTPTGSPLISAGRVFGFAAVIGAINSLLFAVAVTVGAFVYNVSADLVGGVEVTLSERD
jgi:hypothetical protein